MYNVYIFFKNQNRREREREQQQRDMGNGNCGLNKTRNSAFDGLKKRSSRGDVEVDENVDVSNDSSYVSRVLSKHSLCSNEYTDGHFGPVEWQRFHKKCTFMCNFMPRSSH